MLDNHSVAAADNAADFTRNFMQQLGSNGSTAPAVAKAPVPAPAPTASAPSAGGGGGGGGGGPGQNVSAPVRGKGVLTQQAPGMRVPLCGACDGQIR